MSSELECLRFRSELSSEQEESVKQYLSRTTLLWNYIVQAMTRDARNYVKEPASNESDQVFLDKVLKHFELITEGDIEKVENKWKRFVAQLRELPLSVLYQRLRDLVEAYETAKKHYGSDIKNPTRLPKNKTVNSSQSARFNPNTFLINGDVVSIEAPFKLELKLDGLNEKLNPLKHYTFSITKRQVSFEDDVGPTPKNTSYVFTFKEFE